MSIAPARHRSAAHPSLAERASSLVAEREITMRAAQQGVPHLDRRSCSARRARARRARQLSAAQNQTGTTVAVSADAAAVVDVQRGLEITEAADRAAAEKLVRDGDVEAAIVGDPSAPTPRHSPSSPTRRADESVLQLAQAPPVELLDPRAHRPDALRYLVAFGFGIVFLIVGDHCSARRSRRASSRRSRRGSSRSSLGDPRAGAAGGQGHRQHGARDGADPRARRASRVIGLTITGQTELLGGARGADPLVRRVLPFGFVLLAALFAAAAAMVSRQEDIGSTTTPADDARHGAVLPGDLLQRQPDGARDHVVRAVLGAGRDADAAVPRRGAVVGAVRLARDPHRDVRAPRSWSARGSTATRCCRWARG